MLTQYSVTVPSAALAHLSEVDAECVGFVLPGDADL